MCVPQTPSPVADYPLFALTIVWKLLDKRHLVSAFLCVQTFLVAMSIGDIDQC